MSSRLCRLSLWCAELQLSILVGAVLGPHHPWPSIFPRNIPPAFPQQPGRGWDAVGHLEEGLLALAGKG